MNRISKHLFFTGAILLFSAAFLQLNAQAVMSGAVYYSQMDKIEFEPTGRPEFDQFARTMPTEYTFEKMLYFDENKTLFQDSPNPSGEPLSGRERWFYNMSKFGRKPTATLQKIYCDFNENQKTEIREFMTREFRVESEIELSGWKMTGDYKSILGYTCMGAQLTDGDEEIIAYFTPQIPIQGGPDKYHGLPGLILAIEKNGYTTYLASKIEAIPVDEFLKSPDSGKKVTQEELDKIIDEKIEEFKEERMGRGNHPHSRRH
jgi:GLPGLI family protein